ncbi:MAG: ABC transporter permease [Sandaracinaceae bacterium]
MSAPKPRRARVRRTSKWGPMAALGIKMMFHDRAKLAGTLLGVVFATVLMAQQLGVLLGLLYKNTQFVDNTACDIWIAPPGTAQLQPGSPVPLSALTQARVTEGVAWAEPLLFGGASVRRSDGGTEAVTLVGSTLPRLAGGPWAMVAGEPDAVADPSAIVFEDSARDELGGLDLGSVAELSGHRVVARGFTWGLLPFGPSYAFGSEPTVRDILRIPVDQASYVLVGVEPGADVEAVAARLQDAFGDDLDVITRAGFHDRIVRDLVAAQLGISFGTSTAFALIVGFVIVALSMFSSVVDNVREFGTLKAIGASTFDLTKLLLVQAVVYALVGSTVGLFLATRMAEGIRSPNLSLVLPPELFAATYVAMTILCAVASALAILRVKNLEPAMVFR